MKTLGKSLILGAMLLAGVSQAQTVRINGLVELSGTGATSGTNFDNGIKPHRKSRTCCRAESCGRGSEHPTGSYSAQAVRHN